MNIKAFGTAALAAIFVMASSLAHAQSLLRDAEIEAFIREHSDPLFAAAGLNPDAVEIYLVGDPDLNAFVGGGQKMFIHTGLLTAADNPNQIEGVIAHETGHLAAGHQQRGADAMAAASRPAMIGLLVGAAAIAIGAPPELGMAAMGAGQTVGMANYLSYNRGQESAADQAAVRLLEDTGTSGKGLVDFFDKLADRQLIMAREIDPYLLTHPLARQRITALQSRVEAGQHYGVTDSEEERQRLAMLQAKIWGFLQEPNATLRLYPLSDDRPQARYAQAIAFFRNSELDRGLAAIDRLIAEEPDNPYFQELKGQMLFEHGRLADSVEPHRRSVEIDPQSSLLRLNLGRSLIGQNDPDALAEGVEVLKSALRLEADNSFAWSELARAQAMAGDEPGANLSQAQAYFSAGNMPMAHRFAWRAEEQLPEGTPGHLQALDILAASEDDARQARNRGL